jgi:VWFA-related protein
MTRHLLATGLAFASLAAAGPERWPETRITVHVAVEDGEGAPVAGLPATAFAIVVDGERRTVDAIVPTAQPMSILLLVDTSQSMAPFVGGLEKGAREFVASLDAADRIRVGTFSDEIRFSPAFTADKRSFRLAPRDGIVLRKRAVTGGSPLWDAVYESTGLLVAEHNRRVLVVISDGRSSGNHHSLEEAAEFAGDGGVSVNVLAPFATRGIRQDRETVLYVRPAANIDRLTQYTGGLMIGGYDAVKPVKQLGALGQRLRAGYAVTFAAPADGRRHRLDVQLGVPGLRVRAPLAIRVPDLP